MAQAVSDASIVCCFMTPEYENSKNCKLELEHAQTMGKSIIPCMVSNRREWKPSPSKWLGFITSSTLALDFSDTSEESIIRKTRELIKKIRSPSSVPTLESTASPEKLIERIKETYLTRNRINRIVNEEIFFPIEQSYINLAIVETKEQHEKEKKLQQKSQQMQEEENEQDQTRKQHNDGILSTYEEIYGVKTSIDVKKIIQKCKDQIKKVLVLGRAGIGKSTFCQYVTYQWAKGEIWSEYHLVVLILLRKLTNNRYPPVKSYSPVDIVEKEYFPFGDLSNEDRQLFKEQYNKGQVLWILDGYDEFTQNIPEQLKDVFDHIRTTQHHILTSRPYCIALAYDVKMEITGFTNENIAKYVEHFFDQNKDEIVDISLKSQKLLRLLEANPSIWGIAHIPVNLELICSLWTNTNSSKTATLTMTQLYSEITEWLCRRYLQKQKNINHENMTKAAVYRQCKTEILFLEHLAFKAMKRSQIMLVPALLEEVENETECELVDHPQLLNMGILKSYDDKLIGSRIETSKQHYFVHLSFQEYFAARKLLKILKSSEKQIGIDFINDYKYNQRFHFVFVFASGLLAQSEFQSSQKTFWETIRGEPFDLVGFKHIKLVIECIDQLIDTTTEFPYRTIHVQQVSQWIAMCITKGPSRVRNHLLQSLQRASSLANNSIIQNTFIELLQSQNYRTIKYACAAIANRIISNPTSKLALALVAALQHENWEVQNEAAQALGNITEKMTRDDVISALIEALGSCHGPVQRSASKALAKLGQSEETKEVIAALLNALQSTAFDVRLYASETLEAIGEKATSNEVIAALLNATNDEHSSVRWRASRALAKLCEEFTTNGMIAALLNALYNKDSSVREKAAEALGKIGAKVATNEVIIALQKTLGDEEMRVRQSAGTALKKIGEKAATSEVISVLLEALHNKHWETRCNAADVLGEIGEKVTTNEVIVALQKALADEHWEVRRSASNALQKMGEKAATAEVIAGLLEKLGDAHWEVRWSASDALGKMGEKAATNEVIAALLNPIHDDGISSQQQASRVLGKMGRKVATNTVITALLNELSNEDFRIRDKASEALGEIGAKAATNEVIDALQKALGDEHWEVRWHACNALRNMLKETPTNKIIAALLNALSTADSMIRRKAAEALGEIGEKSLTIEMINAKLNKRYEEISNDQYSTSKALSKISENAVVNELIPVLPNALHIDDSHTRDNVPETQKQFAEEAITNEVIIALVNALHDKESDVRRAASEALGKFRHKAVTNKIIPVFLDVLHDHDSNVRCKALEALGKQAVTNEAIVGLVNALEDKDIYVQLCASRALGEMGEKAATNEVMAALANLVHKGDPKVQWQACRSLGYLGTKAATNEVITELLSALQSRDYDVRRDASGALREFGEKAATNQTINVLASALRDNDSYVQQNVADALGKIGEQAATNQVIANLVNASSGERKFWNESSVNALERCLSSYNALKDLDSETILKLHSCMKMSEEFSASLVPSDHFIKVFLDTENETWLPLVVYVATLKGIAVTVVLNHIRVYDGNGLSELRVFSSELMEILVRAFKNQKRQLEGNYQRVSEVENET
ncbi:unnamed protein product [Rotaria socialis]|uniref:NACHT domain-containing protein n=1 Tax=Rotaria socialis TaxID=392032 RepID=A0A818S1C7_9BILA|nr:unnamed protein product [Rotaria socialis]CAF4751779.1 unnamed protein product [Rotaria socialis]